MWLRLPDRNSNLQDFEASITPVLGATGTLKSMDPMRAYAFFGMDEADFSHINEPIYILLGHSNKHVSYDGQICRGNYLVPFLVQA